MTVPTPGSKGARSDGCTCPVLDNAYGRGYMGGVKGDDGNTVFVRFANCPLHGFEDYDDGQGSDIAYETRMGGLR
jgi:hypothetical protein